MNENERRLQYEVWDLERRLALMAEERDRLKARIEDMEDHLIESMERDD